jgi:hypothetical protein
MNWMASGLLVLAYWLRLLAVLHRISEGRLCPGYAAPVLSFSSMLHSLLEYRSHNIDIAKLLSCD